MIRAVLAVAGLTGVYALGLASVKPADLATGVALAALLVGLVRPLGRAPGPSVLRRAAAFPRFAAVVAWDVVTGGWQVALTVLGIRPLRRSGIVAIPIGDRTPAGIAVSAFAVTLSPGEVLVDVDRERGVMLVQALDATDPDGLRRRQAHRYELQRRVVP